MKLKSSLVAASLAAAALSANAVPTVQADWTNHDPAEMAAWWIMTAGALPIDHVYKFSLAGTFDVLATGVSNDAPPVFDINGGKVELFADNGDADYTNDASKGFFSFDSLAANKTFLSVTAGNYFYRVTGTVDGKNGGSYLLSSSITPVPEPETYALMLAGLAAVGFISRRRNKA
ncbi:FxDxF family PEP-CTERM protein [Roseateles toxinivorans]|uniref:Putative secreted protein with PEP-CTERM sorting signal n=1 Tax=Roseateles toxinivorans TaxID=270368 RepID=A0A4R6QHN5_9BURK|nr:FxDxF family PEP-CTERM protein [Roseateles toxinivorans]TDP62215.1 putative secreted protein with PEP-CTERM sorting signal [Roseateles toxinivorans]